jgi:DNA-binding NtrC family response regulator
MVTEGKFREDLYFRLSVVPITLPPLRARKEDLPLLVQSFLKTLATDNGKPFRELTGEAMQAVLRHDWPGNVRELRTAIEHGVVMAPGPKITVRDLPAGVRAMPRESTPSNPGPVDTGIPKEDRLNLQSAEEGLIEQALAETGGNITLAAKRLGMSRRTLHRRLAERRTSTVNAAEDAH